MGSVLGGAVINGEIYIGTAFGTDHYEVYDRTGVFQREVNLPYTISALGGDDNQDAASTSTNYDLGILDFVVPADGVYTIRVTASAAGDYGLVVTDSLTFDTEPNDSPDGPLRDLTDTRGAIGFLGDSVGGGNLFVDPLGDTSASARLNSTSKTSAAKWLVATLC